MKKNTRNQKNNNLLDEIIEELQPKEIQKAIILAEIIGKPASKRRNRGRMGRSL